MVGRPLLGRVVSTPVRQYGALTGGQWARVAEKTERFKLTELLGTGGPVSSTGDLVADLAHERRWLRVRRALARLSDLDGGATDGTR
jgi:hypothetical protein